MNMKDDIDLEGEGLEKQPSLWDGFWFVVSAVTGEPCLSGGLMQHRSDACVYHLLALHGGRTSNFK